MQREVSTETVLTFTSRTEILTLFPQDMQTRNKIVAKLPVAEGSADNDLKKDIGERIASIRRGADLTARQVAEKMQIKRETLSQIENGRNNPTAVMLWKLACVLHCEVSDFFPPIPQGHALTRYDMRRIERAGDTHAAEWAATMFGKKE